MKMDLNDLSDKKLKKLFEAVKNEVERREKLEISNRIIEIVKENGFYIEKTLKRLGENGFHIEKTPEEIEGLTKYSLALPVQLMLQARTHHPNDYDENAKISRVDLGGVFRIFEGKLPELENFDDYYKVGDWDTDGYESAYYSKGIGFVIIWFKSFPEKKTKGVGIDLNRDNEGKSLSAFFEKDEKYYYFSFEPKEYKLKELKENYSKVPNILKTNYFNQKQIEIDEKIWEFSGEVKKGEHLQYLKEILPI